MTKSSRPPTCSNAVNKRPPARLSTGPPHVASTRTPPEERPTQVVEVGHVKDIDRGHPGCAVEEALQLPGGLASSPIPSATEYGGFWDRPLCMAHIRGLCRPVGALPASPMGDAARPSGTLQPLRVGSAARGPGMPSTGHRGREKQLPLWSNSSDLAQEPADGGGLPPA